jgi:hypothetical protein
MFQTTVGDFQNYADLSMYLPLSKAWHRNYNVALLSKGHVASHCPSETQVVTVQLYRGSET